MVIIESVNNDFELWKKLMDRTLDGIESTAERKRAWVPISRKNLISKSKFDAI